MCLEGAARQNSHPVIAMDFYHWPGDVRSRDDARFCVTLPWRRVGWQCKRDPTIQQWRIWPGGLGRKVRATAAGRRKRREKGRRREATWIESDCTRSNVADKPSNPRPD